MENLSEEMKAKQYVSNFIEMIKYVSTTDVNSVVITKVGNLFHLTYQSEHGVKTKTVNFYYLVDCLAGIFRVTKISDSFIDNLRDIEEPFKEYLKTLDDEHEQEYYLTDRQFAESWVEPFIKWLKIRNG